MSVITRPSIVQRYLRVFLPVATTPRPTDDADTYPTDAIWSRVFLETKQFRGNNDVSAKRTVNIFSLNRNIYYVFVNRIGLMGDWRTNTGRVSFDTRCLHVLSPARHDDQNRQRSSSLISRHDAIATGYLSIIVTWPLPLLPTVGVKCGSRATHNGKR